MKKILFLGASIVVLAACSEKTTTSAVEPVVSEPSGSEMTADATQGKQIYQASCQRCHALKNIDDFSKEQWSRILPSMSKKAKLEPDQTAFVDAYIQWELQN